ncbi:prepilin-type N-terminal cleavage/methylation domain-containing protein [Petrocella sp. FN5]|uniref:prepilin-type N-terminal cleavage/methylation domain-containing protein n=1 Tax=Petrocella sp. FN5 TaxID=3032002 RepID=UPI0023DC6F2A|nr:prepilin-type N-terminal cleavage/methylation domain-containing protein [Petrocella sp. FN5]MDF1617789.1 prepilin-type N-terminal cleavage/methylation domain-containing protein [Petrocella sp. FN5]
MKTCLSQEKGFTLIEIIISIALLSIVSVIVLRLFVLSYTINEEAKISDEANTLIVNQLESLKTYDNLGTYLKSHAWLVETPKHIQGQSYYDVDFRPIDTPDSYTLHWSMVNDKTISNLYHVTAYLIHTTNNETLTTYTTKHYFKYKE